MITEWTLGNFKAVNGRRTIPFGRVTVFAGLNSSGKSTVLQSILATSQTLSSQNGDRALILNGPQVQLGAVREVVNDQSGGQGVEIGFELAFEKPSAPGSRPVRAARSLSQALSRCRVNATLAVVAGESPVRSWDSSQFELQACVIETSLEDGRYALAPRLLEGVGFHYGTEIREFQGFKVKASIKKMTAPDQQRFLSTVDEAYHSLLPYPAGGNYSVELDSVRTDNTERRHGAIGRRVHFLPLRLLGRFNIKARALRAASFDTEMLYNGDHIFGERGQALTNFASSNLTDTDRNAIADIPAGKSSPEFSGSTFADLISWAQQSPLKTRAKRKFVDSVKVVIASALIRKLPAAQAENDGLEGLTEDFGALVVEALAERLTTELGANIRYLGPLRAEPQAAQRFAPSNEREDVGVKGEFAAAVFEANRKSVVTWYNPETRERPETTLEAAVDWWAKYLGVAHHLSTRDAGHSGVSWTVQMLPQAHARPLESVGIGVSQVLPILVCGLLARQGAIILIEQPELHLHPRAQARLADFFVSLQATGRQCIIETHSDCLVARFRLLLVSGQFSGEDVKIYFVRQDSSGAAQYDKISVSPSGAIANWPDGFFDESVILEDKIAQEAIRAKYSK